MKLSGSLGLAVIVGTKAVEHSYSLCVCIDLALAVFLLYAILFQTFLLLNFTLNGHLSRLTLHGHLQVACTLFFVKFKFHTQ